MAEQVSTPIHPVCQSIYDRLDALAEVTRRAARYLAAAVIGAAEDISAMTSREVSHA